MRKIINGRLYDTELATCLASTGGDLHNFFESHESLFRTPSGAWFLYGCSSAGGTYGRSSQGGRELSSGDDIIPLDDESVLMWASYHRIADDAATTIATLLGLKPA